MSFEYYLVLDFESTCQEGTKIDPQEIIEFPCLLVRADDLCLVDQVLIIKTHLAHIKCFSMMAQFHEYVKPVASPLLTNFCTDLTGITQDMIQVLFELLSI